MKTKTRLFAVILAAFVLTALPACAQVFPIQGSFVNFERGLSGQGWAHELDNEVAIGHNTLPIEAAGQFIGSDQGTTCLPTDVIVSYSGGLLGGASDNIGLVMSLAQARNMQVWVGSLQTSGRLNSPHLQACNQQVAKDIYGRFPGAVFAGIYDTSEISLDPYQYPTSDAVTGLGMLVSSVKAVAPGKRVLIAPTFKEYTVNNIPGVTPFGAASILNMIVSATGVQVVAPQDGVGAQNGAPPLCDTGSYYQQILWMLPYGTELWSDLETFQYVAGLPQDKYPPAPISRIVQQVAAERPYVTKMISWEFGRDMSDIATYYPVAASELYMDYLSYYNPGVRRPNKLKFTYSYGPYSTPSSSYPDSQSTPKLNDGQGAGYPESSALANSVGFASNWPSWGIMTLDFGQYTVVNKIRILVIADTSSGIFLPTCASLVTFNDPSSVPNSGCEWTFTNLSNTPSFSYGWLEIDSSAPAGGGFDFNPQGTRYISLGFQYSGWLFVSEVEAYN